MYARKCSINELHEALAKTNEIYNGMVEFNRNPTKTSKGVHFTLKMKNNKCKGHSVSHSGRNINSACWHVHGDFFDMVFMINKDASILSLGKPINRFNGNWQDYNVGSMMQPKYASESCNCNRDA